MAKRDHVAGARRVYELQRAQTVKRGRQPAPVPTWEELTACERRLLTAAHRVLMAAYDEGRKLPREVRL